MNDDQIAAVFQLIGSIAKDLHRIADALDAQAASQQDELIAFPLSAYGDGKWLADIGATIVAVDDDGVSAIRTASGKIAKRRSNDKFGTEIWFSFAAGKGDDGTPKYTRVVEFRDIAPPEPLGRKTEQAVKKAAPVTGVQSPVASGQLPTGNGTFGIPIAPPPVQPTAASDQPPASPLKTKIDTLAGECSQAKRHAPKNAPQDIAILLNEMAGGEAQRKRVLLALTGRESIVLLGDAYTCALFQWLKPARTTDHRLIAANASAKTEIDNLLKSLPADVPAESAAGQPQTVVTSAPERAVAGG